MYKPRILMIGNYLSPPLHNKNVWHYLAERLSANGWSVITTSSQENQVLRLFDMLTTIIKRRKEYDLAQVDVFSGKAFIWAEFCVFFLVILKKPIMLTLHGGALPQFASKFPIRVRRLLKAADRVMSPSPYLQQSFLKFRFDIKLIPNPIDLSASIYQHREIVHPNIIWVRSFHEIYNPSLAVRVLKMLQKEFPEILLTMIGPDKRDGSLEHALREAQSLGIKDKLKITGAISHNQVPVYLNEGDIFINTTNYDTAPRSLLEAMANGLCVVSTNVGGIPWIIQNGKNGLLVPPDDASAMAAAVKRILLEPGLAASLSQSAHDYAQSFDWFSILPQWEEEFLNIAQRIHKNA